MSALREELLQFAQVSVVFAIPADAQADAEYDDASDTAEDELHAGVLEAVAHGFASVFHEVLWSATLGDLVEGACQLAAGTFDIALDGVNVAGHVVLHVLIDVR